MFHSFILAVILYSPVVNAEDVGKFSTLATNEPAPFEGVLFDPIATAHIVAQSEIAKRQCDLEVEYQLDNQATEFQLERQELNLRIESLTNEYSLLITQKDLEIAQLQKTIRTQAPRNNWIWYAGGIATGFAITYGGYNIINK